MMSAAQFLDLKAPARIAVGAVTSAALMAALRLHVRARRFVGPPAKALSEESQPLKDDKAVEFRTANTEAAFAEVCRASQDAYGEANVSPDRTLKWWRRYSNAVLAVYCTPPAGAPELIGQVSIWPLKAGPYRRLRSGQMQEGEVSHQSIASPTVDAPCSHWYVSNVLVHKAYRRSALVAELLARAIRGWSATGLIGERVHLLAFAYSADGEKLLRRFGFMMLRPRSPGQWPIFELELSRNELPTALMAHLPATTTVEGGLAVRGRTTTDRSL